MAGCLSFDLYSQLWLQTCCEITPSSWPVRPRLQQSMVRCCHGAVMVLNGDSCSQLHLPLFRCTAMAGAISIDLLPCVSVVRRSKSVATMIAAGLQVRTLTSAPEVRHNLN